MSYTIDETAMKQKLVYWLPERLPYPTSTNTETTKLIVV